MEGKRMTAMLAPKTVEIDRTLLLRLCRIRLYNTRSPPRDEGHS